MPFMENNDVLAEDDYMLRVCANQKAPVGGIDGFDHLEIDLSPLHVQVTYDIYRYLWSYFFPLSKLAQQHSDLQAKRTIKVAPSTTASLPLNRSIPSIDESLFFELGKLQYIS